MMTDKTIGAIFSDGNKKYRKEDLIRAFEACGMKKGDSVLVHSELKTLGKVEPEISREKFLQGFIDALVEGVGEEGTIILPTFSYSFCKQEVFDPEKTPSTVGILTEYFRKLPGAKRSREAIFSVSALGKDASYFTEVKNNCFGVGSIFEKLFERNALLLFIGERFDITFMHFIEQRIGSPYRFEKEFSGKILEKDGILSDQVFVYNVRPLDQEIEYDLENIAGFLLERKALRTVPLGWSKVRSVRSKDAFVCLSEEMKKDPYLLLVHPPEQK